MPLPSPRVSRRQFLAGSMAAGAAVMCGGLSGAAAPVGRGIPAAKRRELAADESKALITITLDLEMSRHYPKRGMMEWDFQKGNLDDATKAYSVAAAEKAAAKGGFIHFFCVGRVLEHKSVDWLNTLIQGGHPIGNHTYDHVYVLASTPEEAQFRFRRSPWLAQGKTTAELIEENIRITTVAMQDRLKIDPDGFRTPGGFQTALDGRADIQQMLLDQGFSWVSCKYPAHEAGEEHQEPTAAVYKSIVAAQAAAQPYVYPSGLVEVPMSPISDVNAFRTKFWKLEYFKKAIRLGVEWAIENRACYDFLAHPSCLVVEDPQAETIQMICDIVNDAGDKAVIVDCDTIAERARLRHKPSAETK